MIHRADYRKLSQIMLDKSLPMVSNVREAM